MITVTNYGHDNDCHGQVGHDHNDCDDHGHGYSGYSGHDSHGNKGHDGYGCNFGCDFGYDSRYDGNDWGHNYGGYSSLSYGSHGNDGYGHNGHDGYGHGYNDYGRNDCFSYYPVCPFGSYAYGAGYGSPFYGNGYNGYGIPGYGLPGYGGYGNGYGAPYGAYVVPSGLIYGTYGTGYVDKPSADGSSWHLPPATAANTFDPYLPIFGVYSLVPNNCVESAVYVNTYVAPAAAPAAAPTYAAPPTTYAAPAPAPAPMPRPSTTVPAPASAPASQQGPVNMVPPRSGDAGLVGLTPTTEQNVASATARSDDSALTGGLVLLAAIFVFAGFFRVRSARKA
jgi:hypothetical protein